MNALTEQEKSVRDEAAELLRSTKEKLAELAARLPKTTREIRKRADAKRDPGKLLQTVENDSYVTSRINEVIAEHERTCRYWDEWFDESRWGLK